MGSTANAFCTSAKQDLMSAIHCFNGTVTPTGTPTNTSFAITSVSALTGIAVGMSITGTNIPASSVIASIDSSTQITISKAATGSPGSITLTIGGDSFMIALIKNACTGTYGAATTNYTDVTGNSDEVVGTGYSAGGQLLANNTTPTNSGTTAWTTWSANPSWTSATIDCQGSIIYNNSRRGPVATRTVTTQDFGGEQKVTAGTLTLVMPTANSATAIIRVG